MNRIILVVFAVIMLCGSVLAEGTLEVWPSNGLSSDTSSDLAYSMNVDNAQLNKVGVPYAFRFRVREGPDTVTVIKYLGARLSETGTGTSTIDIGLYDIDGGDTVLVLSSTLGPINGTGWANYWSEELNDTLEARDPYYYLRFAVGNMTGSQARMNTTIETDDEGDPTYNASRMHADSADMPLVWEQAAANNSNFIRLFVIFTWEYVPSEPSGIKFRRRKLLIGDITNEKIFNNTIGLGYMGKPVVVR